MAADKRKKVILWSAVLVLAGIGGYFAWKKWGKRKDGKDGAGASTPTPETPFASTPTPSTTDANTALAIEYRIWANSTEELSKKYGKKSQFDLDSTSRTPYNEFFLKSYAAGKAEFEKAKAASTASSPSSDQYRNTPWQKLPLSFSKEDFAKAAKAIHERLWEYTGDKISAADSKAVLDILKMLKHGNDATALNNAFGKRCYKREYVPSVDLQMVCPPEKQRPLLAWLGRHLNEGDKRELNAYMDALQAGTGHSPKEVGFKL